MSTSDAGDREQRAEEGETATTQRRTPRAARTSALRSQQDESFGERFQQENPSGDERPDQDQDYHGSGVRQDEPHTNLRSGANRVRQDEAAPCACSQVQLQKPSGLRFTSSLFFILSKSLRIDTPEVKLKPKLDSGPHSVTGTQRAETEVGCCQVNRRTSPLSETTSVCLLARDDSSSQQGRGGYHSGFQ
ncbi:uncharacterized protein LOC108898237 isoform X3 [Lates calcarifer]|uniref:Uncharacterized protein LOC108898237 isoform X3 n=1 Tax=Lates calcarifer TaxID=8187 RepID=A0AAJ8AYK7_LATCA|nr:uncharacterized protein LOC108898237 isoform X3 [Lates calcarifer]